jgi:RNA polymerase sigma-70 factor (ECF subfamily)
MDLAKQTIDRAAAGDQEAQRTIYELLEPRAFRLTRRIVGENNAADVTQEAFLRMFSRLSSFRHEAEFTTWFHCIVVNVALLHRRKQRVREKLVPLNQEIPVSGPVDESDHAELLERALGELEPSDRMLFELKEVDELPYREIAQVLGIPEGTVGSRLNRVRHQLRERLQKMGWGN